MINNERMRKLIEEAECDIEADDHEKAAQKLFQALGMTKQIPDKDLSDKILQKFSEIGIFCLMPQSIELTPIATDGLILDIGGGGEGIIGKLNGKRVVAIDISERELAETQNEAMKVVMDATDLKFLPNSFDVCTSLFSLMYIPKKKHLKVFEEVYRVLRDNGRFLIWDVRIPRLDESYNSCVVPLELRLPNETVETGYGVEVQTQDIKYFKELAQKAKFTIANEWNKDETFHLQLIKIGTKTDLSDL